MRDYVEVSEEPRPPGYSYDPKTGIAIRFIRRVTLFGCGRTYVNDEAGAKRHAKSGCKRCRRAQRRREAILRRQAAGE